MMFLLKCNSTALWKFGRQRCITSLYSESQEWYTRSVLPFTMVGFRLVFIHILKCCSLSCNWRYACDVTSKNLGTLPRRHMTVITSQIIGKHQSSALHARFEWNLPVADRFPSQRASNATVFPCDDVIMNPLWIHWEWMESYHCKNTNPPVTK